MWLELGAAAFAGYAGLPTVWLRWASGGTVRHGPANKREVALTFDDGPDPVYTPQVLEKLAAAGARATFFMLGSKAAAHPETARAVVAGGHEVGSHLYHHLPTWILSRGAVNRELARSAAAISAATGQPPTCLRPPWGLFNAPMLARRRPPATPLVPVLWSVHPGDWLPGITAEQIATRVLGRVRPGSIVLLHDGTGYPGNPTPLVAALPHLLAGLQEEYRLVTLSDWLQASPRHQEVSRVESLGT